MGKASLTEEDGRDFIGEGRSAGSGRIMLIPKEPAHSTIWPATTALLAQANPVPDFLTRLSPAASSPPALADEWDPPHLDVPTSAESMGGTPRVPPERAGRLLWDKHHPTTNRTSSLAYKIPPPCILLCRSRLPASSHAAPTARCRRLHLAGQSFLVGDFRRL